MRMKVLVILVLVLCTIPFYAQEKASKVDLGFSYGMGNEFKNRNYTFTNQSYKVQFYYVVKQTKNFKYALVLQPEINFASHQLLNIYFVEPDDPDYIAKRERYTKLKDVKEYVLNLGFLVRKPVFKSASIYVLGSIGPMIIDTETERLSKGFAFSDVLAVGFTFRFKGVTLDVRPNIRHVSNGGLQKTNAGYTTKNIDFGFSFSL
ncbi:hypothetical protein EKL99_03505 [Flavobacterium sp. ZB4P23]|nr:hypothetical protein EKL99_03505 [Flavobacterium sp. ZB4P23]